MSLIGETIVTNLVENVNVSVESVLEVEFKDSIRTYKITSVD